MPPRRSPDIAALVNEQLLASLPNIVNQVAAGFNAARQSEGTSGASNNTPRCSYKAFMSCKPKEFKGSEGAVGLLHWIEGIETVLHISKCAEADKVEYASCQLKDRAQTWWKNQIQVRGREAANQLPWAEFVNLLTEEYCPKDERQKLEVEFWNHTMEGSNIERYTVRFHELARLVPHMVTPEEKKIDRYVWGLSPEIRAMVTSVNPNTIHSAQVLATRLTNDLLRSGVFSKGKRKADTQQPKKAGGNHGSRPKKARNFGMTMTNKEQSNAGKYVGPDPKCNKCNFHHTGECPICRKCNRSGHFTKYCKMNGEVKRGCYECGGMEHFRNNCPRLKERQGMKQKTCYECGSSEHMRNNCPKLKGK